MRRIRTVFCGGTAMVLGLGKPNRPGAIYVMDKLAGVLTTSYPTGSQRCWTTPSRTGAGTNPAACSCCPSITTTHLMRDLRCPFVPFVDLLPPAIAADPHYEAFTKRHNNPSL